MKIAASSDKPSKKVPLIIPLVDDEKEAKLTKENSISWELKTRPTENASPTYKKQVRILEGSETVRQLIAWRQDVIKVCVGLNATDLASRRPIMEACMNQRVTSIFQASLTTQATNAYNAALETALQQDQANGNNNASTQVRNQGVDHFRNNDHLDVALQVVNLNLMPRKVLAKVKRQMRREMRKPFDMNVRAYCQLLVRLNENDIPNLPPYNARQALSNDELLDILLFGTPRSWQNEMDRQGFDPVERGFFETVNFMENIEGVEEKTTPGGTVSKAKAKSKSKDNDTSSSKKKATHYCEHHGPNWTHDTSGCRALKGKEKNGKFNNKTWTRKADESNSQSKKELAALLAKTVQKQVKKELAAVGKKRKSKSDDSDNEECALVQIMEQDLDGFNYEDMEKMSLDDDGDEISV